MYRKLTAAALALACLATIAAPAGAATLTIQEKCAVSVNSNGVTIHISGSGFDPTSSTRVTERGANGLNFSGGSFNSTFPLLGLSSGEQPFFLDASDGRGNNATAQGMKAAFTAKFSPPTSRAKPRPRRRVRITLDGWLGKVVYLHFVPPFPATRSTATSRVGQTTGPCGKLTKTRAHLFPFTPRKGGSWQVIVDTHRGNINFNQAYRVRNQDHYFSIYESVPF